MTLKIPARIRILMAIETILGAMIIKMLTVRLRISKSIIRWAESIRRE